MSQELIMSEVWECKVSMVRHARDTETVTITLKDWLLGCKDPTGQWLDFASTCKRLRETDNEEEQKALKKSLPGVTVNAEMLTRKANVDVKEKIKQITGWTQLDIDPQDNPNWVDVIALREEVSKISFVAYAGLSCRGKGVWALVRLQHPDRLKEHFNQLIRDFQSLEIVLDVTKGKNPTDLRFYSYDPDAYIAESFHVYDRIFTPKPVARIRRYSSKKAHSNDTDKVFKSALSYAQNRVGPFSGIKGNRHSFLFHFCFSLNNKGISQQEAENYIQANLMSLSEIKTNCIESTYRTYKSQFGSWLD